MPPDLRRLASPVFSVYDACIDRIQFSDADIDMVSRNMTSFCRHWCWFLGFQRQLKKHSVKIHRVISKSKIELMSEGNQKPNFMNSRAWFFHF